MRRLRFEGAKGIEDAMMIPDTLPALVTVAKAAEGLPWVLVGSLATSCWMRSRATVVIEILVLTQETREKILGRLGPLPRGYEVLIRSAEQMGLTPETVLTWHERARQDQVDETVVYVLQPRDLFVWLISERRVLYAPAAMSWACDLHRVQGPWSFEGVDLTPYQCQRLAEAAALIIHHAADELERATTDLTHFWA
jgi:hypothetical protein